MKFLVIMELILLLTALLYVFRVVWPVRNQLLNGDNEIVVSIRNRHNLKICAIVIVVTIIGLILV